MIQRLSSSYVSILSLTSCVWQWMDAEKVADESCSIHAAAERRPVRFRGVADVCHLDATRGRTLRKRTQKLRATCVKLNVLRNLPLRHMTRPLS